MYILKAQDENRKENRVISNEQVRDWGWTEEEKVQRVVKVA